ncbi:MAG: N-acetylmuramoyl-L-alanine amidase [Candidatus Moraniibacteriota bacterium]|nr:MAG: N-acetylmuramoyl-L-alanine amidase [Candidatus Moranbacteria bacterium]
MNEFFKNPWTWLLVLFVLVSGGVGIFLFRGDSARVVENEMRDTSANATSEVLSQEDSAGIVEKLEAGNAMPREAESGDNAASASNQAMPNEQESASSPASAMEVPTSSPEVAAPSQEQEVAVSKQDSGGKFSIENRLVSWGFTKASGRTIDTVVVHSTYNATGGDPFSVSKIIDIYKSYGVSPHYLVARDGAVYRMVEEKNIAYHAGDSEMPDGRTNVNAFSIGIEVIGKDNGSPSDAQYVSLKKLLADIKSRNSIKHIVGHSDIAPGRKTDPWGFDWKKIGGKIL